MGVWPRSWGFPPSPDPHNGPTRRTRPPYLPPKGNGQMFPQTQTKIRQLTEAPKQAIAIALTALFIALIALVASVVRHGS